MSFKGFLSKKGITHEIELEDGTKQSLHFKPISVRRLITLQEILGAVSKAIMVLTGGNSFDDIKTTHHKDGDYQTTVSEPVDPEITARKQAEKERALDGLLTVLFHEQNVETVGQLLLDSLKDEPSVPEGTTPEELMDNTEAGVLTQLLVGFGKANKKVLPGPLRTRLTAAWDRMLQRMEQDETIPSNEGDEPSLTKDEPSLTSSEESPETKPVESAPELKIVEGTPESPGPETTAP